MSRATVSSSLDLRALILDNAVLCCSDMFNTNNIRVVVRRYGTEPQFGYIAYLYLFNFQNGRASPNGSIRESAPGNNETEALSNLYQATMEMVNHKFEQSPNQVSAAAH